MDFVLVIPRYDLFPRAQPQGFQPLDATAMEETILQPVRRRSFFVERRVAEEQPDWKQVIPYCLVRRDEELFTMTRLRTGGEKRLHGLRSIGVGGHVNPVDDGEDRFLAGLRREVNEEIKLAGGWEPVPLGLINDDATEVGAVHVGLVFGIRAPDGAAEVLEPDKLQGGFERLEQITMLCQNAATWETWSRLVLERTSSWIERF
jgi:predicted NUDIX family phosphoesterase